MKRRVAVIVTAAAFIGGTMGILPPITASASITINVNGSNNSERSFQGIGGISAGAAARLLADYPSTQQSQILDYLFRCDINFCGAALQRLKVEIGGDENSTWGSEASIRRSGESEPSSSTDSVQCRRGYEFLLMKAAISRNSNIKLDSLQWGAPGWIGTGQAPNSPNFWSQDNANYVNDFINCAAQPQNQVSGSPLPISTVGLWNETNWSPALGCGGDGINYTKTLYTTLHSPQYGHSTTAIVAADSPSCAIAPGLPDPYGWAIASNINSDSTLASDVAYLGAHYQEGCSDTDTACQNSLSTAQNLLATHGQYLWSSENTDDFQGPATFGETPSGTAQILNRDYLVSKQTATLMCCLVDSWFPSIYHSLGLIKADSPWGNAAYTVLPQLWVVAQTAQFTEPGWQYVGGGATTCLGATDCASGPSSQPSGSPASNGSLATGTYTIQYTYVTSTGETAPSVASSQITLDSAHRQISVNAVTPLPTYATAVKWYIASAPNGTATGFTGVQNNGGAFTLNTSGNGVAASPVTGSVVTLRCTSASLKSCASGSSRDFSTIVETVGAPTTQSLAFNLSNVQIPTCGSPINGPCEHVWSTNLGSSNPADYFNETDYAVTGGSLLSLPASPNFMYTITSTSWGKKGAYTQNGESAFPFPWSDNYSSSSYVVGGLPHYLSDQHGAFEIQPCDGGYTGNCLQQVVNKPPICWFCAGTQSSVGRLGEVSVNSLDSTYSNFTGDIGLEYQTPASGNTITITQLGRYFVTGNTQAHTLGVYLDSNHNTVGSTCSVNTATAPVINGFQYCAPSSPIVLSANTAYDIVSSEVANTDFWYYFPNTTVSVVDGSVPQAVYHFSGGSWGHSGGSGNSYGPVDFTVAYNNFSGDIGMVYQPGAGGLTVTQLGRYFVTGNTQSHTLGVHLDSNHNLVGSTCSVNTSTATIINGFQYCALPNPIALSASTKYDVVSSELSGTGNDLWYYFPTTSVSVRYGSVQEGVYHYTGGSWGVSGGIGNSYGPVDLVASSYAGEPTPATILGRRGPTLPPYGVPASGGSMATGNTSYTLRYTYCLDSMCTSQTEPSPANDPNSDPIVLTTGNQQISINAVTPLPAYATAVRWYIDSGPGTTGYTTVQNNGAAFTLNMAGNGTAPPTGDYTIESQVLWKEAGTARLLGRIQDGAFGGGSYYQFTMTDQGAWTLDVVQGNTVISMPASGTVTAPGLGAWHTMEMNFSGSTIKVFWDNTVNPINGSGGSTDTTYTEGGVGLGTGWNKIEFYATCWNTSIGPC